MCKHEAITHKRTCLANQHYACFCDPLISHPTSLVEVLGFFHCGTSQTCLMKHACPYVTDNGYCATSRLARQQNHQLYGFQCQKQCLAIRAIVHNTSQVLAMLVPMKFRRQLGRATLQDLPQELKRFDTAPDCFQEPHLSKLAATCAQYGGPQTANVLRMKCRIRRGSAQTLSKHSINPYRASPEQSGSKVCRVWRATDSQCLEYEMPDEERIS